MNSGLVYHSLILGQLRYYGRDHDWTMIEKSGKIKVSAFFPAVLHLRGVIFATLSFTYGGWLLSFLSQTWQFWFLQFVLETPDA